VRGSRSSQDALNVDGHRSAANVSIGQYDRVIAVLVAYLRAGTLVHTLAWIGSLECGTRCATSLKWLLMFTIFSRVGLAAGSEL